MTDDFSRSLEFSRTAAIVARDMPAIERIHAPEYELITPAGRVLSRAQYLDAIAAEPFYTAWEHGPMRVRSTSAMAMVRYQAKLTFPSGRVLTCWHTDIHELRGDQWQAVWSQATLLAPAQVAASAP